MAGILLIERNGLRIRNVLRAFKLSLPPLIGSKLMMLIVTMKKSRQFQASRRYAILWKTKPMAMTLTTHSMMKMMEKTRSISS